MQLWRPITSLCDLMQKHELLNSRRLRSSWSCSHSTPCCRGTELPISGSEQPNRFIYLWPAVTTISVELQLGSRQSVSPWLQYADLGSMWAELNAELSPHWPYYDLHTAARGSSDKGTLLGIEPALKIICWVLSVPARQGSQWRTLWRATQLLSNLKGPTISIPKACPQSCWQNQRRLNTSKNLPEYSGDQHCKKIWKLFRISLW